MIMTRLIFWVNKKNVVNSISPNDNDFYIFSEQKRDQ